MYVFGLSLVALVGISGVNIPVIVSFLFLCLEAIALELWAKAVHAPTTTMLMGQDDLAGQSNLLWGMDG